MAPLCGAKIPVMGKLEQITGRFIELTRRYSFAITVFLLLLALIPLFNTWSLLFELSMALG